MARYHNPKITTNKNLSLLLDAANPKSYTGVTTSVTDISLNNNTATLYNGVGYTSSNVGYFTFNGINHYTEIPYDESVNLTDGDFTIDFWMNSFSDQTSDVLVSYGNTSTVGGWAIKTASSPNKLQYSTGFTIHPAVAGIVTDGLVLHLDAGDSNSYPGYGTTWSDLSGQGNNGTLTNGPIYSSANGGYFDFDGANDYVSIGNLGLSSNTLEGWINSHTNQGGSTANTIVSALGYYSGSNDKYTYIGFSGNNILTFRIDDGSTSWQQVANVTYTTNQWYHVALSYNSSTGSAVAYVNGSIVGSIITTTGIVFNTNPDDIAHASSGRYFDGFVSMQRIYNKALTPTEIKRNYNALKGRFTSQPSALDPLDLFNNIENADFSSGITTNTWNHYALVRSGNVYTPYVNAIAGSPSYDYDIPTNFDLYFDNASIILNANGDDGSTDIIDSSKNNHTGIITAYNGAGISTAEYKFGGSSLYFDGTNDYIDCGTDPSYAMEDEDFTIEFWIYVDQPQTGTYVFRIGPQFGDANTVPDGGLSLDVSASESSATLTFTKKRGGSSQGFGFSITPGQWNHIAIIRSGSSGYIFVNGIYSRSFSIYHNPYNESDITLGAQYYIYSGTRYYDRHFNGYIDDFIITKGVAKYTEDFTPPKQASYYSNDPNYDNLSILLQGNGQNLSTSIIDSSPYNHTGIITAYNGAGISTAEYKFGGSSLYFDGTDDYIDCGASDDYSFGTGDFTIEFWIYNITLGASNETIISTFNNSNYGGIRIAISNTRFYLTFATFIGSGISGTSNNYGPSISTNQWYHVALVRDNGYVRFFVDGVKYYDLTSQYLSGNFNDNTLFLGKNGEVNGSYCEELYIDDFRITKGSAKYTEDFVPPDRTKIKNNQASLKFGASGIGNTNPFNGALSNLKIYKDSLTQSEITQNFNAHKSRYGL